MSKLQRDEKYEVMVLVMSVHDEKSTTNRDARHDLCWVQL
jgi:hypothetical protein